MTGLAKVRADPLHSLRLPVAPLLAGDTAKALAVLAERETPQASVES